MKKFLFTTIIISFLIVLFYKDSIEPVKEKKYPSEREFIQRTFPYYQYDPSAYVDAIEQTRTMKNALSKKYLAKGAAVPEWEFAGPVNIGGRVVDIEFNPVEPNIVYAGAATGGVFKSTDTGKTWFPVFDEQAVLSVGDIAVDPVNPDIIYVGTGEANGGHNNFPGGGVYKSTDAGLSWRHLGLDSTSSIGRIVINYNNPSVVYIAAVGSYFGPNPLRGVFKSTDGGSTWEKSLFVTDSTGAIDLIMHPENPDWLMVSMWERVRGPNSSHLFGPTSGIYKTSNGGENWELIGPESGLPDASVAKVGRIGLSVSRSQPDIIYALYNDGTKISGLYRSTDAGISWINANPNGGIVSAEFSWYFGQVRVHPSNPNIIYVMDVWFMKSTTAGVSWSFDKYMHVDHHALAFHPQNPDIQIAGNDGGIYLSSNAGSTWTGPVHLPVTQFYEIGLDIQNPQRLYGGTQDNNTVRTSTGKIDDWENLLGGDGFYVIVDPKDPNIIYAESQFGGFAKSTDGGNFWQYSLNGVDEQEKVNWSAPAIMCPFNNNVLYFGTDKVYRTVDGSKNWDPISHDLTAGIPENRLGTLTTIAVSPLDSNIIYAGTDDAHAWVSTDYGTTWKNISAGLPQRWITRIVPDPHSKENVYITFSGLKWRDPEAHVFKSTNQGTVWENITGNLPDAPANAFAVDLKFPGRLYIGLDAGAFMSYDNGNSWEVLGNGLPVVSVYDMKIHPVTNYLVAGTHGRSMYKIDLDQLVDIDDENFTISDFTLMQNYPNPFNPSTRISYTLSKDSRVELKIFSIEGEEVKLLVNERQQPGEYSVNFTPENLASGVYVYRLSAADKTISKKMVYLK